jgi:ribosomal peptide maturation radical SAM protein 1
VASLGLARRIKAVRPECFVVLGGANCEGSMGEETVRQFPFVDAAVSGEGDVVFPEIVRLALAGRSVAHLPGVRTPAEAGAPHVPDSATAPMVRDLDALPVPDYGDYFAEFGESRYAKEWQPSIFFETSRGCWWGERMHCTFCGLNGSTMAFRSKSATRALDELTALTEKHPGCDVQLVDNILDLAYFKDFLPALAERNLGLDLFYETKSNLRKEQVRLLRRAGIRKIQPGIESLSDAVLKLMQKGVTALQNIQLLKWSKELGVAPHWNMIWGFPGEPPEEYARMAALVPLLTHLPPPRAFGSIRLDRFSPNFFDAERRGFTDVTPLAPYRHVYDVPEGALHNLAYFFAFGYREPRDVASYVRPLARRLAVWQREALRSELLWVAAGDALVLLDSRSVARQPLTVLKGVDRAIYEACDAVSTTAGLAASLDRTGLGALTEQVIAERLEPLVEAGLVVRDGGRYLALAVSLAQYAPPAEAAERLCGMVPSSFRMNERGKLVVRLRGLKAQCKEGSAWR